MALSNINPNNCILIVNGRRLTEWGTSDSPISITTMNPKREMIECQNGDAIVAERAVQMFEITVNLKQHSADSSFMSAIYNSSGGQAAVSYTTMNTGESFFSDEGIVVNIGDSDRGGVSASDDTYTMQFNDNVFTRGSI